MSQGPWSVAPSPTPRSTAGSRGRVFIQALSLLLFAPLLATVLLEPRPVLSNDADQIFQWTVMSGAQAWLLLAVGLSACLIAGVVATRARIALWLCLPAALLAVTAAASQSQNVRGRVVLTPERIVRASGWPGYRVRMQPTSAVQRIEVRCLAAGWARAATFDYQIVLDGGSRLTLGKALPDRSPATISRWVESVDAWDASPGLRQVPRAVSISPGCVEGLAAYLTPSALEAVKRMRTRAASN